jgi:uncharacterized protein (TIGR02996 family)
MSSRLDLAAVLPGEADLLAAVAANPADDATRLVYADWLEDRGDPRGPFLRRFVDAVQKGRELPDAGDAATGWLEIVGVPLVNLLRSLGLSEHRAAFLTSARPAVAITTETSDDSRLPVGGSKFGGLPSLARGSVWPRCKRAPLEFLAQFDLEELSRTVAGRALPPTGLLSFFMYHNYPDDQYGGKEGRGVKGGLQILHTPAGADLIPLDPPDDLTEDLGQPRRPCRLSLVDALDVPDGDDRWPKLEGSLHSRLLDAADHQLFGYSHVTVLAGDPTPGPKWEQLIRFNSDRNLSWGWGDGHRLFWYIRSADLRGRRFGATVAIDG